MLRNSRDISNEDVAQAFLRGDTQTTRTLASLVLTEDGHTVFVSYGYAVLGHRRPNGHVTVYEGWSGFSQTTSTHLGLCRRRARTSGTRLARSNRQPELTDIVPPGVPGIELGQEESA